MQKKVLCGIATLHTQDGQSTEHLALELKLYLDNQACPNTKRAPIQAGLWKTATLYHPAAYKNAVARLKH